MNFEKRLSSHFAYSDFLYIFCLFLQNISHLEAANLERRAALKLTLTATVPYELVGDITSRLGVKGDPLHP